MPQTRNSSYHPMDPLVKEEWIEALRSGEYKQGTVVLRDEQDRFSALGVLVDTQVDGWWQQIQTGPNRGLWVLREPRRNPTPNGTILRELTPDFLEPYGLMPKAQARIMKMNDEEGKSFKQISTWIKRYL